MTTSGPAPVRRGAGCVLLALVASCGDGPAGPGEPGGPTVLVDGTTRYGYRIVDQHPHDPEAFTQGLVLDGGVLFEGTGLRGRSSLRRVERTTGAVLQQHDLAHELFGEGIAVFDGEIVQLTWTAGTAFVYDEASFAPKRELSYETEGWGITHDGTRLVMSDGTSRLYFREPDSFEIVRYVTVRYEGEPVARLNELEYIEDHVFANVWQTDRIAVIDPGDGEVVSWIDLTGLLPEDERADADVLNGIAFDPAAGRLLVTGKLWPRLFEIELVPEG